MKHIVITIDESRRLLFYVDGYQIGDIRKMELTYDYENYIEDIKIDTSITGLRILDQIRNNNTCNLNNGV